MNELEKAAIRQALEALESFDGVGDVVTWEKQWRFCHAAITALRQALANEALDRMAENARELGLDYDVKSDHRLMEQPAQEPVALETVYETIIQWDEGGGKRSRRELARRIVDLYTSPPAQEPVAYQVTAYGNTQAFIKRADVADETASRLRQQFDSDADVTVHPLYTRPQPVYTKEDIDRAYSCGLVEGERMALEQQPADEPVAIADGTFNHNCPIGTPLYTSPQPAQQEPVAWIVEDKYGERLEWAADADIGWGNKTEPLYTCPQAREPLTDEQIDALVMDSDGTPNSHLEFARAIEAKLREKNGGKE